MDHKLLLSKIPHLQFKYHVFIGLVILLTSVIMLLSCLLLFKKDKSKTIIIPATFNESFWVDEEGVSSEYLGQMTRFLAQELLNLTPSNSEQQLSQVLKWVHPSYYPILKKQFIKLHQDFNDKNMTTVFYPQTVKVLLEELKVIAQGLLDVYVVDKKIEQQLISITLSFSYEQGHLYLLKMESQVNEKD